jgi:hypothetical protein
MGTAKDNMQTTDLKKEGSLKAMVERLADRGMGRRKKKPEDDLKAVAETFADQLADLDKSITALVDGKTKDLNSEGKSAEAYNKAALKVLEDIQTKVDEIVELVFDYRDLKH